MKCLVFGTSFIPLQTLEAQVTGFKVANGSSFPALHRLGVKIQMFRHLPGKNQMQVPVKGWLKDACDESFHLKNMQIACARYYLPSWFEKAGYFATSVEFMGQKGHSLVGRMDMA